MSTRYKSPDSEDEDLNWKQALLTFCIVVIVFLGIYFLTELSDPSWEPERNKIYRVAYSNPKIVMEVGLVKDVSFLLKKKEGMALFSRGNPLDWERTRKAGVSNGKVRLMITGTKDAGLFSVTYVYFAKDDRIEVISIDR